MKVMITKRWRTHKFGFKWNGMMRVRQFGREMRWEGTRDKENDGNRDTDQQLRTTDTLTS